MQKKVVILGSSGGNLYNLGGKDPNALLGELIRQIQKADMTVSAIQFIAAEASMDHVHPTTKASLWTWDGGSAGKVFSGTLEEVNAEAVKEDERIAACIENDGIDGVILVSADPEGANRQALHAAAAKKLAATGTGGTSMAKAQAMGLNVVAVSGTTGTTNRTRAIANVFALSKHWGLKYQPAIGGSVSLPEASQGSVWSRISVRGVLMASLPGFIAMALTLILSKIPGLESFEDVFNLMIEALPVIVAAVAAKQVSGLEEVAVVAGVITGVLSVKGGLLGGIIGGILAGVLVQYLLMKCLKLGFPTTTANIVSGGISGLLAGLAIYLFIGPLAIMLGDAVRYVINTALEINSVLCGGIAGLLIWPAIMGGMYHGAILPIILLEMEKTGNSFLGAIDMVGLVMVSAGIMLANVVYPRVKDDRTLAAPGLFINMVFGTFVEAAYPFMFSSKIVLGGAFASACIGGLFVGFFNVRGTAYVPSIVAPTLSSDWLGFLISMAVSMFSAFLFTILANKIARSRNRMSEQ